MNIEVRGEERITGVGFNPYILVDCRRWVLQGQLYKEKGKGRRGERAEFINKSLVMLVISHPKIAVGVRGVCLYSIRCRIKRSQLAYIE
jgi:hypothetical protein